MAHSEPLSPPKSIDNSNEINDLKKAVEDAASTSGGLWLSYIFVLFYIGVAAGAVTHEDLLLEHPVKLPFLDIELPLKAFFFLAPLLLLVSHIYTLAHFSFLGDKAKLLHDKIKAEENTLSLMRTHLPSNVFVQLLAGPENVRNGSFGSLLKVISSTTMIVGPLTILSIIQLQFLPYHHYEITFSHRIIILLDYLIAGWLWSSILGERGSGGFVEGWVSCFKLSKLKAVDAFFRCLIASIGALVVFYCLFVVTFQDNILFDSRKRCLFMGEIDENTQRCTRHFSKTLILPEFSLYEALKIDDPEKVKRETLLSVRGRDLAGAIFKNAHLPKVDFSGANLEKVDFTGANLEKSSLNDAKNLECAKLAGTKLPDSFKMTNRVCRSVE